MDVDFIVNDDCLFFVPTIPRSSVDLAIIDIPYYQSESREYTFKKNGKATRKSYKLDMGKWDHFDSEEAYLNWVDELLKCVWGALKLQASLYIFCKDEYLSDIRRLLKKNKFYCNSTMVWIKRNPLQNIQQLSYNSACEFFIFAVKVEKEYEDKKEIRTSPETFNWFKQQKIYYPKKYKSQPYEVNMHNYIGTPICMKPERVCDLSGNVIHTTQKPLELLLKPILVSSNKGDVVLDCCCGVGSTLEASKLLERHYIGCEVNEMYYDYAKRRLDGKLHGYSPSKRVSYLVKELNSLGKNDKTILSYFKK